MGVEAVEAAPIAVSMIAPDRVQCGISDYSRHLLAALSELPGVNIVRCAAPPESTRSQSHLQALSTRSARSEVFRKIGQMVSAPPAKLTHIQHEYSLFGGVAPHRNVAGSLYSSISTPIVLTVHEIVDEVGGDVRKAAIRHVNRSNFIHDSIRSWIVHTNADKRRLCGIGVPLKHIHVVPMGVPAMKIEIEREEARERLGLANNRVLTLFGFISEKKGHLGAIEALTRMSDNIVLVLAGGKHPDDRSDYIERIEALIAHNNLKTRVRITGYLSPDELDCVMAATDLAIAPYNQSSGSASVAQLMAAGLPVVASRIPVFEELNEDAPGTLALEGCDAPWEYFGHEVLSVLYRPTRLKKLRDAAIRYASAHTYQKMAEATVEVYREALA